MKNSAVLAVPFLLLTGQAVSAQYLYSGISPEAMVDDWHVIKDFDVIDDSVTVELITATSQVEPNPNESYTMLSINCDENVGYPTMSVLFHFGEFRDEIRTLGGLSPSLVFKTSAFNRSATSPADGNLTINPNEGMCGGLRNSPAGLFLTGFKA